MAHPGGVKPVQLEDVCLTVHLSVLYVFISILCFFFDVSVSRNISQRINNATLNLCLLRKWVDFSIDENPSSMVSKAVVSWSVKDREKYSPLFDSIGPFAVPYLGPQGNHFWVSPTSYDTHMTHTNDREESNVHTKNISDIFYCFISRVEDKSSVGHWW